MYGTWKYSAEPAVPPPSRIGFAPAPYLPTVIQDVPDCAAVHAVSCWAGSETWLHQTLRHPSAQMESQTASPSAAVHREDAAVPFGPVPPTHALFALEWFVENDESNPESLNVPPPRSVACPENASPAFSRIESPGRNFVRTSRLRFFHGALCERPSLKSFPDAAT